MRTILLTDHASVFAAHRDARASISIPQLTHAVPRKRTKTRRFTTSPESFSRPPQTDGAFYACYLIPGISTNTGTCPLRPILYFSTSFLEKCVSKNEINGPSPNAQTAALCTCFIQMSRSSGAFLTSPAFLPLLSDTAKSWRMSSASSP